MANSRQTNYPALEKTANHMYSLLKYCFGSQPYHIKTKCTPDEALNNIVSTQKDYGIHVISKEDSIILCATEHARSGGPRVGTPVVPVFTGKFVNKNGDVVLTGVISLELGIKIVMGMFCVAVYVWLPLGWIFNLFGSQVLGQGPFWGPPLGVIVFTCLLEFGYNVYTKDLLRIKNFLESVLSGE